MLGASMLRVGAHELVAVKVAQAGGPAHNIPMNSRVYVETSVISYLTARPSRDLIMAAHQEVTSGLLGYSTVGLQENTLAAAIAYCGGCY
jgi:hypothetical protein